MIFCWVKNQSYPQRIIDPSLSQEYPINKIKDNSLKEIEMRWVGHPPTHLMSSSVRRQLKVIVLKSIEVSDFSFRSAIDRLSIIYM